MQQTLRRLDGVANVKVDLLDGDVTMTIKPDSNFDPASVLKLTYDSGVSVTEIDVISTGQIVSEPNSSQGLLFQMGSSVKYPVVAGVFSSKIQAASSSHAVIRLRGILYERPAGKTKKSKGPPTALKFQVQEVM